MRLHEIPEKVIQFTEKDRKWQTEQSAWPIWQGFFREQFPSGFNSALLGFELRVGANYYFSMGRFAKRKPGEAVAK